MIEVFNRKISLSWTIIGSFIALSFFMFGFILQITFLSNVFNNSSKLRSDNRIRYDVSKQFESNENIQETLQNQKQSNNIIINANFNYNKTYKFNSKTPVPNIVSAWREGKVDWHSLIPKHNSIWERFGTPQNEGKLPLLVSKEIQVTDYLTRFHESGLSSKYGHEYGNLLPYSGCNIFSSTCMIHNEDSCNGNEFCYWDNIQDLCVSLDSNNYLKSKIIQSPQCDNPNMFDGNSFHKVEPSQCKAYITQPIVIITLDSESQSMYYHFYSSWTTIYNNWLNSLKSNYQIHILIKDINDPMFFHYFGLISDYCWNRFNIISSFPPDICYCDVKTFHSTQTLVNQIEAANYVVNYLQLNNVNPPKDHIKIGIISRRRKRFILNEYELVESIERLGYECILLPLETMTLHEQMYELRSLDILIGIHGSALDNSVFLHPGSVMIQLLPYTVEHRVTFPGSANAAKVVYLEWQLKDRTKAVFHWDLLDQANSEKLKRYSKDEILSMGQSQADSRETLMFWINQDIIVPINEWEALIKSAVNKSNAKKRGL